MAAQSFKELGFRCLIGSSFGDIFYDNCFQQGLLVITLPVDIIQSLGEQLKLGTFQVDLNLNQLITPKGEIISLTSRQNSASMGISRSGDDMRERNHFSTSQIGRFSILGLLVIAAFLVFNIYTRPSNVTESDTLTKLRNDLETLDDIPWHVGWRNTSQKNSVCLSLCRTFRAQPQRPQTTCYVNQMMAIHIWYQLPFRSWSGP